MRKSILAALALAAAFALTACSSESSAPTTVKESAKSAKAKIGETLTVNKIDVTVNSIKFSQGAGETKPKEGALFAILDVTIVNGRSEPFQSASDLMFKVQDAQGYAEMPALYPDAQGTLSGEIGAGRKLRGELVFEVPKAGKSLELLFEPDVIEQGQGVVQLGDAKL